MMVATATAFQDSQEQPAKSISTTASVIAAKMADVLTLCRVMNAAATLVTRELTELNYQFRMF